MMSVVGVDCRNDLHVLWDSSNGAEEVYCGFKRAEEDARTCKKEVTDGGRLKVERGPGALAFQELQV